MSSQSLFPAFDYNPFELSLQTDDKVSDCLLLDALERTEVLQRRLSEAERRCAEQDRTNRWLHNEYDNLLRLHTHFQQRYKETLDENNKLRQAMAEQRETAQRQLAEQCAASRETLLRLLDHQTPPQTANHSAITSPIKQETKRRRIRYASSPVPIVASPSLRTTRNGRLRRKRRLFDE